MTGVLEESARRSRKLSAENVKRWTMTGGRPFHEEPRPYEVTVFVEYKTVSAPMGA